MHGVEEVEEETTLPDSYRYQPINVLEHSDRQQFILDKYVDDKVRNYYNSNVENKHQEKTRKNENNFYSLNNFVGKEVDIRDDNREHFANFAGVQRESYNANLKPHHKQVKKSAQFSNTESQDFNLFFDKIHQNPNAKFPSFDFTSSFPQFNDGAKFFQNDENEKTFQVHNSRPAPASFLHF